MLTSNVYKTKRFSDIYCYHFHVIFGHRFLMSYYDIEKCTVRLLFWLYAIFSVFSNVRQSYCCKLFFCSSIAFYETNLLLQVDNFGTVNLVEACRTLGVNKFILISSILVNGAAMGQLLNPAYIFLNVFGLTLIAKLQAEQNIRKSGINYTIIRPGGLKNDPPKGNIVMEPEVKKYRIKTVWFILSTMLCFLISLSSCSLARILCMKVPYLEIKLLKLLWRHCYIQKKLLTKQQRLLLVPKLQNVRSRKYLVL